MRDLLPDKIAWQKIPRYYDQFKLQIRLNF